MGSIIEGWNSGFPVGAGFLSFRGSDSRSIHVQYAHHLNGFNKLMIPLGKLEDRVWITGP